MWFRVVCLAGVLGCHPPRPAPLLQAVGSLPAVPVVPDGDAVITTPSAPPPVLVLVTAETNATTKSRVRLAAAGSWPAIANVDETRATPIDELEVATLLRAGRELGWTPARTVEAVGKPADMTAVDDLRDARYDDDHTPMTLDEPPPTPDPRSLHVAAAGGFGLRGLDTDESTGWGDKASGDLPMRMAEVAGEVVEDRRLKPETLALVLARPASSARTLIDVLAITEGALAVVHEGHVTALRTQFVHASSDPFVPWIELRVPAKGTYELEAVADTPVALHAPSELGAALAKLRTDRKLDPWNPIDILVGPNVTAQDLVDLIVAADRAGAHAIGLGRMPEGKDLAVRGHPIRQFLLRQLAVDGDVDRHPLQVALNELPLAACYETALATHPGLEGAIEVSFAIAADGTASGVTATGVDDELDRCIAKAIATLHVPAHGRAQAKATFLVAPHTPL